jgi:hypothetical protein
MAMGGFSYGGIDVRSTGMSRSGVLGRTNNTNAQAAERGSAGASAAGGDTGAGAMHPGGLGVVATLIGFAGILFALYLARRNSEYLQRTTFGLNWYSTVTVTLVAVIGIVLLKALVNKVNLGPVTTVVNAV